MSDLSVELELADEDEAVMYAVAFARPLSQLIIPFFRYKVGETFLHMPLPRALKRLERDQSVLDDQVSALSASADECEQKMKELKVLLYAKFGRAINLDE